VRIWLPTGTWFRRGGRGHALSSSILLQVIVRVPCSVRGVRCRVALHRSMCLVVSGVIMFICAVIIMALPFYAAELPKKAIIKGCGTTPTGCKTGLAGVDIASLSKYDFDTCFIDLKIAWGCSCTPSATTTCNKPDHFSCKNANWNYYYLAQLYEWWDEGMWIIGAVGLAVSILFIAIPAFMGAVKGASAVVAYSVCCGIFFLPFLFIGACFLVVGGAFFERCAIYARLDVTSLFPLCVPCKMHMSTQFCIVDSTYELPIVF
jgi:hypothetical protein